ncbi:hypothetical protein [Nocardioides sp.]|uniref:hypothetical protein n=1 Tax=Nocardioides sp. TaxID=35761 RepID=UPI0026057480|nr:hypothetical protein [Nocardioides sp.]
MTTSYYRIQHEDRDVQELLDPEFQVSFNYNGRDEDMRAGISVCASLDDLARYIANSGVEIDPHHSVIVELTGPYSDDEPCDADQGELLIMPTAIIKVTDATEAGFYDLIDAIYEEM